MKNHAITKLASSRFPAGMIFGDKFNRTTGSPTHGWQSSITGVLGTRLSPTAYVLPTLGNAYMETSLPSLLESPYSVKFQLIFSNLYGSYVYIGFNTRSGTVSSYTVDQGLTFRTFNNNPTTFRVASRNGGADVQAFSTTFTGTSVNVEIQVNGKNLKVYLNEVLKIDSNFTNDIIYGASAKVAYHSWRNSTGVVSVDDFICSRLEV